MASSCWLVASAFCKASANRPERTCAALNSFVNPVLSVKNLWRALMTNASTSTAGKRNFA
jgi:hypothetical protein